MGLTSEKSELRRVVVAWINKPKPPMRRRGLRG